MFKKKLIATAVAAVFALPGMSLAQDAASPHTLTANIGFFSDYSFRGLTQTMEEPAVQGGFDYVHSSGLYLGTWGSNISGIQFADGSLEWDFYGGWSKAFGDFGINGGAVYYYYPGAEITGTGESYDTLELVLGGSWKWLSARVYYAVTDFFGCNATSCPSAFNDDSKGSIYFDLSATYPVTDAFSVTAHVGKQTVEGSIIDLDYTDYRIGANYLWEGFNFGLAYKDTDAEEANYTVTKANGEQVFLGDGTVILSVTRTF
ncbi:MAG TPA: TorF family putative porin [Burkholderiales bacterium]|jgi:uncharacterized protein (TIGR02001 family)|nr:TorF family putative porin [Burkholderiales bacterium]